MSTRPKGERRGGDRHKSPRPGDRHKSRKDMRGLVILFTASEFEAVTARAKQDGITKQDAGRTLFLNYAKRGFSLS